MIDFSPILEQPIILSQWQHDYTREDLIQLTHEMVDTMLELVNTAKDAYVSFIPLDLNANIDTGEPPPGWTLAHLINHTTATAEECAAISATLSRGINAEWRNRYELPYDGITTVQQLRERLEDSRRMRLAYFEAWLRKPYLDTYWRLLEHRYGALNAVGFGLLGFKHDSDHLPQIKDTIRQAREALG